MSVTVQKLVDTWRLRKWYITLMRMGIFDTPLIERNYWVGYECARMFMWIFVDLLEIDTKN